MSEQSDFAKELAAMSDDDLQEHLDSFAEKARSRYRDYKRADDIATAIGDEIRSRRQASVSAGVHGSGDSQ